VPRAYRWRRVVLSLMMPLLFGTMFVVPADQAVIALIPLALVALLLRRVLLPRWLGKN
jgi:hypothetical protein